jgi:acyl carrier protein
MQAIKEKVRSFVVENFLFGTENGLEEDTSFLEDGIVDSTGILELVDFLEKEYGLRVEDEELTPENLDSISNIAVYVAGKMGSDVNA